jgi:hypothetical protein
MAAANPFVIPATLRADLSRGQNIAFGIGGVFLLLTVVQLFIAPGQFFRSWMIGFMYAFGAALGSLALLMLQYMTGGGWGMLVRRQLEAGSRTLPYMTVLFIPLLFGLPHLYEWTDAVKVQASQLLREKSAYLNVTWWIIRAAIVFAIWNIYSFTLNRLSAREEQTGDISISKRLMGWSGVGLLIYVLTLTSAAVDWLMSMNATWFSTIFGLILLATQGLTIVSTVIVTTTLLMREPPLDGIVTKRHLHDLGKLLFMFTLFWTYVSFSQLLIIWSGNLPKEITWYVDRMNGSWGFVATLLLFFQWMLPFLILLSQDIKKNPKTIRFMAIWIIVIRLIDMIWLVEPNFHPQSFWISWSDITAPLGFGGIWVGIYLMQLKQRPLLAANAPDFKRYLEYVPAK